MTLPLLLAKHENCPEVEVSATGSKRSRVQTNALSEVVPGTVEIPERVPLRVVEEVVTAVVPDEDIAQSGEREGE